MLSSMNAPTTEEIKHVAAMTERMHQFAAKVAAQERREILRDIRAMHDQVGETHGIGLRAAMRLIEDREQMTDPAYD